MVWGYRDQHPILDHVGSAHSKEELVMLEAEAERMIAGGQLVLGFSVPHQGLSTGGSGSEADPLPMVCQRAGYLLDAIRGVYEFLDLPNAVDGDEVVLQPCRGQADLARIEV